MELCEDLVDRMKLYGISAFLDEQATAKVAKLKENWQVKERDDISS